MRLQRVKRGLAIGTAGAAVAGASLIGTASPAEASHTEYCGHGTNYGTHAGRSYRVIWQSSTDTAYHHYHYYTEWEYVAGGYWEFISRYSKVCG
jgi:hypothetical protein